MLKQFRPRSKDLHLRGPSRLRSDLSHWRKRLGDKLELVLAESLRVAHEAGALRCQDLKRVTVDTAVHPKAITFPSDARLLHAAISEPLDPLFITENHSNLYTRF